MTKSELIDALAQRAGTTKRTAEELLNALTSVVAERAKAGQSTALHGFGTFRPKHHKARMARNPRTGDPIPVPARTALAFDAAKANRSLEA